MAITGTLYLFGEKGSVEKSLVQENINLSSEISKTEQIKTILKKVDQGYRFESVKDRGSVLQTRPTSRDYYSFKKQESGFFNLYKIEPNFLSKVIEVHKGHGPRLLKNMQKTLGISLVFIIFTGFLMSMKIKTRVRPFIISAVLGTTVLAVLFYI